MLYFSFIYSDYACIFLTSQFFLQSCARLGLVSKTKRFDLVEQDFFLQLDTK